MTRLNFLHGLFRVAIKRECAERNPVAMADQPPPPAGRTGSNVVDRLQVTVLFTVAAAARHGLSGRVRRVPRLQVDAGQPALQPAR